MCRHVWSDMTSFLSDADLLVIGYQVDFFELENGFFLFNHNSPRCGTTLSISVSAFSHLYDGEVFETRKSGSEECPGYCLRESALEPCPVRCECAYVRESFQVIKNWPKTRE